MARQTRHSLKRKAEENAAETAETAATSQSVPFNTKFGQASEVISRYFGFRGVPRRFTKPSSDNGSSSSLHSCPASSEDEYEDEEDIANIPPKPASPRREGPDSSSLATERLTLTPEAKQKDAHLPPTPKKRRTVISEAGTPPTSESHHYSPLLRSEDAGNETESIELSPQSPTRRLSLSLRPIDRLSTYQQPQTKSSAILHTQSLTRSQSPISTGGTQALESKTVRRAHSAPHDRDKASPTPMLELTRSDSLDETDDQTPNVDQPFADDLLHDQTLLQNDTPASEYRGPTQNDPDSRDPSPPPSSRADSPLEPLNMVEYPPLQHSPSSSALESINTPPLPTTELRFEPRTSPASESHTEDLEPSRATTSSKQTEETPTEDESNVKVSARAPRTRHGVTKKRTLFPGSKEEREVLVALYTQENGDIQTIRSALQHLSGDRFTRGRRETERLLRILGQAENDGEVTLRGEHRRRARELKRRDAQLGSQTEEHHSGSQSHDERPSSVHVESNAEGTPSATGFLAEDDIQGPDEPIDAVKDVDMNTNTTSQQKETSNIQVAEDAEHTEDIIYVFGGLRPSRSPGATVKQTAVERPRKSKAVRTNNTTGCRAFHSCVRCRVGLLDEIVEDDMVEEMTVEPVESEK
ncbi:hypothetical protein QBC40DRAFT_262933 [Triangularia verruculosa]|uniref:Uncharacterized protein n=1 Tax=Triangularia verruculosa TaxID=2587418 RepID=A0AAN6XNQ5_9PEZI|nr:hypothetical protein QBC40DRAFT_262933 [Triangularia verruculosa]